jgi:serine/threonine-protein kinase
LQFDVSPAEAVLGSNRSLEISYGYRRPSRTALAIAPDGRALVFSGDRGNAVDLYVRRFDQDTSTVLPRTTGAESPFFSPDGKWIGFWQDNKLRKSLLEGGSPVDICPAPRITGASWTPGGIIVYAAQKLYRVADAGGQPEELAAPDAAAGEGRYQLPTLLPGGQLLVYTATTGAATLSDSHIVVRPMSGGPARTVMEDASDGRFVDTGHLVFARGGALFAAPFDPVRGVVTGGAVNVVADVMHAINTRNESLATNAAQFAFSKAGHLAYLAGGASPDPLSRLVWADGTSATRVGEVAGAVSKGRISPDGRRLLVATRGRERALKVYDLATGTLATIGVHGSVQVAAEWLTDNRVVFSGVSKGFANIYVVPADGSAAAERLTTAASDQYVASVSPDSGEVLFVQDRDIWVLTVATRTTRRLFATPVTEQSPTFSPDGRWIAYEGDDGGRQQVYVRPYPDLGQRIAVGGGGRHPRWSRDGRQFFYLTDRPSGESVITAVDVDTRTELPTGRSRVVWSGATADYVGGTFVQPYDVTKDGGRILVVRLDPQPAAPVRTINVVLNWTEELKRLVPTR